MVRDITLGQFMPGESFIHKLDARTKLILLIVYLIFIFACRNYMSLLFLSLSCILMIFNTKIGFLKYLKSMKALLFMIILTGIFNLFYGNGKVLLEFWVFKITEGGVNNAVFVIIRIAVLMLTSSVLTYTTSPTDLTDGIEKILKPFDKLHVKSHEIAMMMTIALRFIPVLIEETDKIMNAQKARGADMESGSLFHRVKALIPVLIPLFVSSIRRANDLAMAMECRCYHGGKGRTRMNNPKLTAKDLIAVIISVFIFSGVILLNIIFPAVLF